MVKQLLFLLVSLFTFSLGFAQDEVEPADKPTVFVDYFTFPSNMKKEEAAIVRNNVLASAIASGRVITIDAESDNVQANEKLRRTQNDMSVGEDNSMERLSAIGILGAEYVLSGQITSLTSARKERKSKDGKMTVSYEGKVSYTINLIRVKDGTLVTSNSYSNSATEDTERESMVSAVAKAGKMAKNIKAMFPIWGTVLEVSQEKKNKAEEVYINVGSKNGIAEKTRFMVYAVRQVAGRTINKEIGDLSVESVEGSDISCCKVKKGGDLILKAWRDGETMLVKSYERFGLFD